MMNIAWRSAKWYGRITQSCPPARIGGFMTSTPRIHATSRAISVRNPPITNSVMATSVGAEYFSTDRYARACTGRPMTMRATPMREMAAKGIAKKGPLSAKALGSAAAIGTLAAVAIRNSTRTVLDRLGTALADHVNWVHGSHSIRNSSVA